MLHSAYQQGIISQITESLDLSRMSDEYRALPQVINEYRALPQVINVLLAILKSH